MPQFKTNKQFSEFLKMLSINNKIEEVAIEFRNGSVYSQFQDRDLTIRGYIEEKCESNIECTVGIFKLPLLRSIITSVGPETTIEFKSDSLEINGNNNSQFRVNLCDISLANRPEKVRLPDSVKFPLQFTMTKEQIDDLMSGCSLVEKDMFRVIGNDDKHITFIAGEDKGDNFKYSIPATTSENLSLFFNKENIQIIFSMCKDKKVNVSIMPKIMKVDVVDDSNNIVACYMLSPIKEVTI